jgi:hypothetical protein
MTSLEPSPRSVSIFDDQHYTRLQQLKNWIQSSNLARHITSRIRSEHFFYCAGWLGCSQFLVRFRQFSKPARVDVLI